jgi:hypothetical protein
MLHQRFHHHYLQLDHLIRDHFPNLCQFNTVSNSGSGIDIDEDSYENVVYNDTPINIPDPPETQGRQGNLHQIITRIWNMK